MILLKLIFAAVLILAVQGSLMRHYYEDIGCVESDDKTYNCPSLPKDKCYYEGKNYAQGESFKSDVGCIRSCDCRPGNEWTCVRSECPTLFNRDPGCTEPNRAHIYDEFTSCCHNVICNKTELMKLRPDEVCQFKDKTYIYGEKIEIDTCHTCICGKEFDGTFKNTSCAKYECSVALQGLEQVRSGCVPIYYGDSACCPIPEWRCPSESDKVVDTKEAEVKDDGPKCKFGGLDMKIGQFLAPPADNPCYECSCVTPPHPRCIMNKKCYEDSHKITT